MENGELNLVALAQHFSNEDKAREFIEKLRWPDGPVCPHCGEVNNAYRLEPKPTKEGGKGKHVRKGVWKCGGWRGQFPGPPGNDLAERPIPPGQLIVALQQIC